jgi:hypothetical protein
MQYLKKITARDMGLTVKVNEAAAEASKPKPVSVLRVWGIVSGRKDKTTDIGTCTEFSGEIAGLNLLDGEQARSSKMFLPAIAETFLNKVFEGAAKDGGTAQFALEVTVIYKAPRSENSNFTKFEYGVKPVMEFDGEDALSVMAKSLPAPKMLSLTDKSKGKK